MWRQESQVSMRDQEGRRGSEEAVPGPSVFPSWDPGVSGDFFQFLDRGPGFIFDILGFLTPIGRCYLGSNSGLHSLTSAKTP